MTAARAAALVLLAPALVPILGIAARVSRGPRRPTWVWRAWWFYGYRLGLYRLNWATGLGASRHTRCLRRVARLERDLGIGPATGDAR